MTGCRCGICTAGLLELGSCPIGWPSCARHHRRRRRRSRPDSLQVHAALGDTEESAVIPTRSFAEGNLRKGSKGTWLPTDSSLVAVSSSAKQPPPLCSGSSPLDLLPTRSRQLERSSLLSFRALQLPVPVLVASLPPAPVAVVGMSGFADLCECLCAQFSQSMANVESLLRAVNGQQVVTSQGFDDSTTAFGLPPRPTSGVSASAFATVTMVVLFLFLLLSLRRQVANGGAGVAARERERERAAEAQGQLLSSRAAQNEDGCGGSGMHQRPRRDDDAAL